MQDELNKVKIIENMKDDRWITASIIDLSNNEYKIKLLKKVEKGYYKNLIINSIKSNNEEIINALGYVENEKDKSLILTKLSEDNLKLKYLGDIHDDINKSRIIMTIDNDDLKLDYINKLKDKSAKSLLIASLKDEKLRNNFLGTIENKYATMNVPNGMTIGMEIECEGDNSLEAYLIEDILEGWNAKDDTSLNEGIEITSPILTNSSKDTFNIYLVCNLLKELGQNVSERCGGHIHIGADFLKTKEAYANLIELWSNNEELLFLLSNTKGEISRESVVEYATPISNRIGKAIDTSQFCDYNEINKKNFVEKVKYVQEFNRGKEGRRTDINFLNVENDERGMNTIEFRLSNGTIDADTWIENANLFGGVVATAQKISDIQHKNIDEIDEKDKTMLEKFTKLNEKKITNEERLNMFLDLCVPKNLKQIYIDRYLENNKILNENVKVKKGIEGYISDKIIKFDTKSIENIANKQRFSQVKDAESELRKNFLEYKNPRQTKEKDKI
jgi:hypothetical protein